MKITIEYDDGMPFASHRITPEDAAAWRARFGDATSKKTEHDGTAADLRAREFAGDLVNATRAALMDLAEDARNDAASGSGAVESKLPSDPAAGKPTEPPNPRSKGTGTAWGFPGRLARGHFGLAPTWWGFGFGGLFAQWLAVSAAGDSLAVGAIMLLYNVLVLTGIWKAANRYDGRPIWARLAKVTVVLSILGVTFALAVAALLSVLDG